MTISFVASGNDGTTGLAASNSITGQTIPAGVVTDDFLILYVVSSINSRSVSGIGASGWTHSFSFNPIVASTGIYIDIYTRFCDGTESIGTIGLSGATTAYAKMYAYRGVSKTSPVTQRVVSTITGGSGTTLAMGTSGNQAVGNSLIFAGFGINSTGVTQGTAPSWTDPNSQLGGRLTDRGGGGVTLTTGAGPPGMGIADALNLTGAHTTFVSSPALATWSSTQGTARLQHIIELAAAPNEHILASPPLRRMTGSAAVTITDQVAVNAALGHAASTIAVALKPQFTLAAAMQKIASATAVTVGDYLALSGQLGKVSGTAVIKIANAAALSGALHKLAGSLDVGIGPLPLFVVGGAMGKAASVLAVTIGEYIASSGAMQKVAGSLSVSMATGAAIAASLKALEAVADVDIITELVLSASMRAVSSLIDVTDPLPQDGALINASMGAVAGAIDVQFVTHVDIAAALGALASRAHVKTAPLLIANALYILVVDGEDRTIVVLPSDRVLDVLGLDREIVLEEVNRQLTRN